MRILGFLKVRNEIIREGNLVRVLGQLEKFCDGGVVWDDASTDGTREALETWAARRGWAFGAEATSSFRNEMGVKARMLAQVHLLGAGANDWVLWFDGDEVLDTDAATLRAWITAQGPQMKAAAFHYTQLWRAANWARTDDGFDDGWFWKLWRYCPELKFFDDDGELHRAQFPRTYFGEIMRAVNRGEYKAPSPCRRAPFEIIHVGNAGKNLQWKVHQYCKSGELAEASLARHLHFGRNAKKSVTYRPVTVSFEHNLATQETQPMPFTPRETALISQMQNLKSVPDLFTVVVPTYNRGYLLDRTLESVLKQTIGNWACVVLDDGSTDDTPARMRAWQDKDPRFFYCRYEDNRGGVAMNEIGMSLACEFGDFWSRLGSDDYFEQHKLELDWLAFKLGARTCYGAYCDYSDTEGVKPGIRNGPHAARVGLLGGGFAASWANIAVHTDVLKAVQARHGQFADPGLRNMEDHIVNCRIARFSDVTFRGMTQSGGFHIGNSPLSKATNFVHDAVWRIGADGASSNSLVCATDAQKTQELLQLDRARFPLAAEQPVKLPTDKSFVSLTEAWRAVGGRPVR